MLYVSGIYSIRVIDKSKSKPGKEGSKDVEAPIILLAPHTSFFDLYPGLFLEGSPSFVSRWEAQGIPFFTNLLKLAGVIFVKRDSQTSRQDTVGQIEAASSYTRVILCPEGTCTNGSSLVKFKPGAFLPGLPVQPIVIRYLFWNGMDTTTWTFEGQNFLKAIWLTMCQMGVEIELTKLSPYYPKVEEKLNARLYAENVRRVIGKETKIGLSEYIFDDVFFMRLATDCGIPRSPLCLKLLKLSYKMGNESRPQLGENRSRGSESSSIFTSIQSENGSQLFGRETGSKSQQCFPTSRHSTLMALEDLVSKGERLLESDVELISSKNLALILGLEEYPSLAKSSAVQELWDTISCEEGDISPKLLLSVGLKLCNHNIHNPWDRIHESVLLFSAPSSGDEPELKLIQFKALLWCLLGIYEDQVKESVFTHKPLTFSYIRTNLTTFFKRAIEDNAPALLL
jgi:1-acyl-sn-glycerol-3-phosphate acyltransferase